MSEKKILAHLDNEDILDVYFSSGRLIYMNTWDESAIRSIVQNHFPQFDPANVIYSEDHEFFGNVGY